MVSWGRRGECSLEFEKICGVRTEIFVRWRMTAGSDKRTGRVVVVVVLVVDSTAGRVVLGRGDASSCGELVERRSEWFALESSRRGCDKWQASGYFSSSRSGSSARDLDAARKGR